MTERLLQFAGGKVVLALEGGYNNRWGRGWGWAGRGTGRARRGHSLLFVS
mgnify:CR=1 FL=1